MTQLTAKGGNDTFNVNGGTLTIDSDTRYGPNTSTTAGPMGNVNLSATLGGTLNVVGNNVRLIQYNNGSANVPAAGTIITAGGVNAELLCVMTTRYGGAVSTNGALPATGWLKVRNKSGGNFVPGAFTAGISATILAPDELGWIEVVGVDSLGISAPRLGAWTMSGQWFSLGSTTGVRGQTLKLPYFTDSTLIEYPGVEIETSPGSGVYAFWANAAQMFYSTNLSTDSRCQFVYIDSTGTLTFGMGIDAINAGHMPIAGCDVRIPNIILSTALVTNRALNESPSPTLGNRYETLTTSAGVINFSKITGSWYINLIQCYSVTLNDVHTCDQMVMTECATSPVINNLHVGLSNRAAQLTTNAVVFGQMYFGATGNNISGLRAQAISSSGYAMTFTNLYGGWTLNNLRGHYAQDATAVSGAIFLNTCDDIVLNNPISVGKRLIISACNRYTINRLVYADTAKSNTQTGAPCHAIEVMSSSKVGKIDTIKNWPGVVNAHPYNGLIYNNTTFDLDIRNIGTAAAPYDCGTINSSGYLFSDGGNNARCKVRRNWLTGLRSGLISSNNTSSSMSFDNCYNTDATKTQGPNYLNTFTRGNRQNAGSVPTSYIAVYGTHFWDAFTGDTTTRCAIAFTEKTLDSISAGSYFINNGTPKFTSQGALVMSTIGDSVTWVWSYFILGWTGLTSFAVAGVNTGNHLIEYDLDKGNGFSGTWKTLTNANLLAETGVSATVGLKPMIRITAITTAVTNRIDSLAINGTTTLAIQNTAFYTIGTTLLSLTGLDPGSEVRCYLGTDPLTSVEIGGVESSGNSFDLYHDVGGSAGYIVVFSLTLAPIYLPVTYPITNTSYPIQQSLDRVFLNQ